MNGLRAQAINMIDRALRDAIEIEEATQFLSSTQRDIDGRLSEAVHAVVHFVTDADLRARDKAYDLALRAKLESYAKILGAP